MVRRILAAIPFALLSLALSAQTVHTFSFGPLDQNGGSASFTLIDGNLPDCAVGYCGSVQVRFGENPWWGLIVPQANPIDDWGFPNNGYNPENTVSPVNGPLIWDNPGCGPKIAGCIAHTDSGPVPFNGYGAGITTTVHVTYVVTRHRCARYCQYYYTTDNTGGTGTAVYTP